MKRRSICLLACLLLLGSAACGGQSAVTPELRTSRSYQAALRGGAPALRLFLADFPKGADLHVHLSGAVYAESFIRAAGEDGLCVDPAGLKFVAQPDCPAPLVAASALPANQDLYDRLVNAFSMRGFVPTPGYTGHDQFFATFARFGGTSKSHNGEWVDEVASRAAAQNQQYLELMQTPPFSHAAQLAQLAAIKITPEFTATDFAALRLKLLNAGLRDELPTGLENIESAEAQRQKIEHCGTPQAKPACHVEVRYIYQILRAFPPEQVFAQTLLGFETVARSQQLDQQGQRSGRFVGINFVQPEDNFVAMRDYSLHMRMLDYLHSVYPGVHISLHAGELTLGVVPPEGLRFHIRQAVELGHAERIGHGVDVAYEDDAKSLLAELVQKHIMVEINLSSNEGILGIKGAEHPFPLYRAAHVPVALSTDDEGVSRIDITNEYVRAALAYKLSYADLKQMVRAGLEHSFLSGRSLWATEDTFTAMAAPCRTEAPGTPKPSAACKAFLEQNQKAASQWELEKRFAVFEKND